MKRWPTIWQPRRSTIWTSRVKNFFSGGWTDGPSAGAALVTALVSALSGRRAKGNVAMTGEISLRGRVLPVGGIKAKLMAAARAGFQTVLLPQRNENDLAEIAPEVLEKLDVHLVERLDQVLEAAIESR